MADQRYALIESHDSHTPPTPPFRTHFGHGHFSTTPVHLLYNNTNVMDIAFAIALPASTYHHFTCNYVSFFFSIHIYV